MLKKMLAGASAVVLGMVAAADAMAECDGIYLGLRGGVAEPDIGDRHTSGDRLDIDDNLFMLSGAIGYRYCDMGKIGDGKVHNQEIYGGVRYVF